MKTNQIKAGAILSYVNLLIGNLIPFIYTPIMLRILGQAEYGLYGIAQSVIGYIQLLNFGIGGAIVRYLSKARAEGDKQGEAKIFGLFIKLYSIISVVILIAGITLSFHLDFYGRSLASNEMILLQKLVRLMTINTAVFLPFNVYSSIILSHERFVFNKLVGMISGIAAPALNLVMLLMGFGSVGLVIATTIINFITYLAYVLYVQRKMQIRPCFERTNNGLLKEIIHFSVFVFLANIVDILYWSTDRLIIGWAIGSVATAVYNIGASFNSYVTSLSTAISGVLMPKITSMSISKNAEDEFTALFIKVGRLQFILISFIVSAFIAFGRQFIALWAGPGYESAYYVALLVMIPVTVPLIQNTGLNILYALNRHKFRSIVYLCIAVLNVVLTFILVEKTGIIGAAMATCIAYLIGNIFIMNWYYHRKIGIDIPLFWKNIVKMCPTMLFMTVIGWFVLNNITVDRWLVFFIFAAVYSVVYFIFSYLFMMNKYEKDLVKLPLCRLKNRLNRG